MCGLRVQGTPWASDGTAEWRRDTKQSYKEPIHHDLSMAKTLEQHKRLRSARMAHMWQRCREVEDKCKALNDTRLATFDARLDFIKSQRARRETLPLALPELSVLCFGYAVHHAVS